MTLRKRTHKLLAAGIATLAVSLCIGSTASASANELARFPASDGARPLSGFAVSGSNVFVPTQRGLREFAILRISQDRKHAVVARYLLPRANARTTTRSMEFRTSSSNVVAMLRRQDNEDIGPVPLIAETVWIGGGNGRLRRVPGRPAGLVAAADGYVATGFIGRRNAISVKIHSTANGRITLLRELDLFKLTGSRIPANNDAIKVSAIDIDGDHLAVATGAATFIANWRTGVLLRTIGHTASGTAARVDMIGPVVITTIHSSGWRSPYISSTTAVSRDTGAVLWSKASPEPFPASTSDRQLVFAPVATELHRVDATTGASQLFAIQPSYSSAQESFIRRSDHEVSSSRFVWREEDCYQTILLEKQPMEQVSRSRESCPFEFVKGSMQLRGRQLSFVLSARHGVSRVSVYVRHGKRVESLGPISSAPGKHRTRLRISQKLTSDIRRHRKPRLSATFSFWNGSLVDSVTVEGRVKLVR